MLSTTDVLPCTTDAPSASVTRMTDGIRMFSSKVSETVLGAVRDRRPIGRAGPDQTGVRGRRGSTHDTEQPADTDSERCGDRRRARVAQAARAGSRRAPPPRTWSRSPAPPRRVQDRPRPTSVPARRFRRPLVADDVSRVVSRGGRERRGRGQFEGGHRVLRLLPARRGGFVPAARPHRRCRSASPAVTIGSAPLGNGPDRQLELVELAGGDALAFRGGPRDGRDSLRQREARRTSIGLSSASLRGRDGPAWQWLRRHECERGVGRQGDGQLDRAGGRRLGGHAEDQLAEAAGRGVGRRHADVRRGRRGERPSARRQ